MAPKAPSSNIDFEKSMAELEQIVQQLEAGDQPLEKALELFEKGITLTRNCQTALEKAEKRISVLTEEQGDFTQASAQDVGDFLDGPE
ncbi:MAG: exodeoxyribonuclease VII small subunit [Gammaproteobacteria bacterium]|nr:exodeoxyribonuclease VII small subunit [Gammaproteobacteria bacterium]